MPGPTRHIVVLGGGGFLMEPENPLLDDYSLRLTGQRRPKVCLIATASGDALSIIERFRAAFGPARASASFLPLFDRSRKNLATTIAEQDVIYVSGGNTANLLALWRLHGVDKLLRRAWRAGVVMTGVSAGMNCWFEACSTDSFGPLAALNDGLGWLSGAACPHYDGEADRRPSLHEFVRRGPKRRGLPTTLAADDGAAAHFVGTKLHACVSSRPNAGVFRVSRSRDRIVEERLPTKFLGASS